MEKLKGNILAAELAQQHCDCGELVSLHKYESVKTFEENFEKDKIVIGFCGCGNILVGYKPRKV